MTEDIDDLIGKEFGDSSRTNHGSPTSILSDDLNEDEKNFLETNRVPIVSNGNGKDKNKNSKSTANNNLEEKQQQKKQNEKRIKSIVCYKYSRRGKSSLLHEAIILAGKPVFITYNGKIRVVKKIEEKEGERIIKPPYQEELPYECYEFENLEEIQDFVNQARSVYSIGQLYLKAKELVKKYNDQDNEKLVLIALDIIFSYFQDKFATTHYVSMVGDNDSGKSSLGITFEALAYRPVYMTDPSAANIFRCLGTIEPGQCTIILDEADKIDKSPEMMAILKTGYQLDGKVPKINTNSLRQEFFYTYCIKIIIGEKSMSLTEAKGVYDRTFSFNTYAGDSIFDIKETLNPQGNTKCRQRLVEILSFRKLLLIYRLIHFSDLIDDIEVGLKRRNRELCKPVMQLFHDSTSEVQSEIKSILEHFLNTKKHRKGNMIEAAYYPLIADLVSQKGRELPVSNIWDEIVGGKIPGYFDAERKPKEYQTDDYGTIYRNTFTNVICDKFGAVKKHKEKGTVLVFDIDKLQKMAKSYDIETNIQLKLLEADPDDSDNPDRSPAISKDNHNAETTNYNTNHANKFEENLENNVNITTEKNEHPPVIPIKSSELSEPSANLDRSNDANIGVSKSTIFRLGHSDTFACRYCKQRGDKWYMQKHLCKGGLN